MIGQSQERRSIFLNYQWDFSFLWGYSGLLARGLWVSIGFTIATVLLGLLFGMVSALAKLSRFRILQFLATAYIELFRCTPVLVQLIWFYYALPVLLGIQIAPATAGILCLSLYGGSFYAEIIRGGIVSIDRGQTEAGQALGMLPWQVMCRLVLPQALRRMIPALMNQSVMQFKNTSLVSILAIPDLLYQGQLVAHDIYRPLEVYTIIAVIYFTFLYPLTALVRRSEVYFSRAD